MRKEFKGTKGEWGVYEYGGTVVVQDIDRNGIVAEVHRGEDIDVAQANAQLIAAAPDMLKALMIINDDIERGPVRYSYQEKLEIVKKTINKALGL